MTSRSTAISALAAAGVLGAVAACVVALRGGSPDVLLGAGLGAGLGLAGSVLEVVLVRRALARPRGQALRIVLGGFLLRLVALVGFALAFQGSATVDAASFALCFLGGFLASLPVLAVAVAGDGGLRNGEARG